MTALAENHHDPEPSTELVPVADDLAEAEVAHLAAAISELGAQGDAARLKEVAEEIDARVVYFRRQQLGDAIKRGIWLRTLAEAELGEILRRGEWPRDVDMPGRHEVVALRNLAIGRRRGVLERAVHEALGRGTLTLHGVARALQVLGALHVPQGALREPFARSGLSRAEVCRRSGVPADTVSVCIGSSSSKSRQRGATGWENAAAVARVLGVEPTSLPRVRARNRRRKGQRRWIHRQRRLSGGRWDEAYVRFRRALDAFASIAGEGGEWDEAYKHWYALELAIATAMKRDAYGTK